MVTGRVLDKDNLEAVLLFLSQGEPRCSEGVAENPNAFLRIGMKIYLCEGRRRA